MKKKTLMCILCILVTIGLFAQDGEGRGRGRARRTVAERVAMVHQKFDSTYHFATDKQTKIDTVFAEYYRAQDKIREEAMSANAGGRPDPATLEALRNQMDEQNIARDEKLQTIMTADEYKKWKNELEPTMRRKWQGGFGRDNAPKEGDKKQ
jgi:periplasmic protein CpxP/Spy